MAFEELKTRQSVMWANGPYQNITETLTDLQDLTVERLAPGPGVHWLDLACGTGAVAERAASAGAEVVGIDLSAGLIETAQDRAKQLGLAIDYRVGDCENLDIADGAFDVVSSTCGVMFAPDHAATARELARVVKPGGRIASLEFMLPPNPVARSLWRVYARLGLPAFGRLISRDWYEVGRFLGPSITDLYRRLPLQRQLELWRAAGIVSVEARVMSFGSGIVIWGTRGA